MNRLFAYVLVMALLLSSTGAFAAVQHKGLILDRIVVVEESLLFSSVSVKDTSFNPIDDAKVVVTIPEFDVRAARTVDFENNRKGAARVLLPLSEDIVPGEYYVRVVVSTDEGKRVRHRIITIE